MMREREISQSYPTKKQLVVESTKFAKDIINNGEHNLQEVLSQIVRLKETIAILETEIKNSLPQENFEAFGIKATYRNGGSVANYTDDIVYSQIKEQLDNRKVLLDAALKTSEIIFDNEGIEVPKVSKTERKSSLSISF
jgi:ABC-type transporter Mla subunit MlaD